MCIIIASESGSHVDHEMLKQAFAVNGDGAGFATVRNGKVIIFKPYWKFDHFLKAWKRERALNPKAPYVIHFRIGTHGEMNAACTHPHLVKPSIAFAHNGILSAFTSGTDKQSDTVRFVREVLQKLPETFLDDIGTCGLLHATAGCSNKFAFLRQDGRVITFGEGTTDERYPGLWFSNNTYEKIECSDRWWKYYERQIQTPRQIPIRDLRSSRVQFSQYCEECGEVYGQEELIQAINGEMLCPDCATIAGVYNGSNTVF